MVRFWFLGNKSSLEDLSPLSSGKPSCSPKMLQIETCLSSRLLLSGSELDVKRHHLPLLKSLFSNMLPTLYFTVNEEEGNIA